MSEAALMSSSSTWETTLKYSWTSTMELFWEDSPQSKPKTFNWVN